MTTLVGVVVLLGGLIFFHELGHYSVAKFFGVRVEVFSLGFGKKIFSKVVGETEYALSIFPLGGYVKLMGDDPYKEVPAAEAHRAFSTQKLYKRFAIVAAGPIANLILAFVLYVVIFFGGKPYVGTQIGTVVVNSPAWEAGIRPGDRVLSVLGTDVKNWNEFKDVLKDKSGQSTDILIERDGTRLKIPVIISLIQDKNFYGQDVMVGGLKGVEPNPRAASVAISDPNSAAYTAGLRNGDILTKIDTTPVETYEDIQEVLKQVWKPNAPVTFTVERLAEGQAFGEGEEKSFSVNLNSKTLDQQNFSAFGPSELLGIFPSETSIRLITPGSPAEKGGLKVGDRVVSLGGVPAYNFESIVAHVQDQGEQGNPVQIEIERDGKKSVLPITPNEMVVEDPLTHVERKRFLIGFAPNTILRAPEEVRLKVREPVALVKKAWSETFMWSKHMLISLGKLASGQISVKNLGGPVLIATVAGKSLDRGIIEFLQMMALISINLFLLNLFPIPILDGGHLLFFTIEAIKGKPVSIRTMEIANQIGMVFILGLVGLTLFNDISRMITN